MSDTNWISIQDAGARLKRTDRQIYGYCRDGQLVHKKENGQMYVSVDSIMVFMELHEGTRNMSSPSLDDPHEKMAKAQAKPVDNQDAAVKPATPSPAPEPNPALASDGSTQKHEAAPPVQNGSTQKHEAAPPPVQNGSTQKHEAAPPAQNGSTQRHEAAPPAQNGSTQKHEAAPPAQGAPVADAVPVTPGHSVHAQQPGVDDQATESLELISSIRASVTKHQESQQMFCADIFSLLDSLEAICRQEEQKSGRLSQDIVSLLSRYKNATEQHTGTPQRQTIVADLESAMSEQDTGGPVPSGA